MGIGYRLDVDPSPTPDVSTPQAAQDLDDEPIGVMDMLEREAQAIPIGEPEPANGKRPLGSY